MVEFMFIFIRIDDGMGRIERVWRDLVWKMEGHQIVSIFN